ncbi:hypothetical protein R3P38DRAFT_2804254 [Favolaschia claudopus]|uniref:Uncharacterized protein n=1 Tax=Favolaschia claudopus TaxID=2862362 RepID=A0AAV9ZQU8_9AGAR
MAPDSEVVVEEEVAHSPAAAVRVHAVLVDSPSVLPMLRFVQQSEAAAAEVDLPDVDHSPVAVVRVPFAPVDSQILQKLHLVPVAVADAAEPHVGDEAVALRHVEFAVASAQSQEEFGDQKHSPRTPRSDRRFVSETSMLPELGKLAVDFPGPDAEVRDADDDLGSLGGRAAVDDPHHAEMRVGCRHLTKPSFGYLSPCCLAAGCYQCLGKVFDHERRVQEVEERDMEAPSLRSVHGAHGQVVDRPETERSE